MKFLLKMLFNGELFFAVYLFAGVFKADLNSPIDITALFLTLTCTSVFIRFLLRPSIKKYMVAPLVVFLFILSLVLVSYLYTQSEIYATEKLIKFIALSSPAILLPFFLFDNRESVYRFLFYLAALSVVLSAALIPSAINKGSELSFVGFGDGNYQGITRLNGVALIILTFLFLVGEKRKIIKFFTFISIMLVSFLLFSAGGRMPIVALLIAVIYAAYQLIKIHKGVVFVRKGTKTLLYASLFGSVVIVFLAAKGFFNTVLYRFGVLFHEVGGGLSASGRIERFITALDIFKQNPIFGAGLGSFPIYYNGIDLPDYPHNIVLEILAEFGLIGFVVFSLYFLLTIYRGMIVKDRRWYMSNLQLTVACLFIYYLANSMVSGDINSNRPMYVFMSLLCVIPFIKKIKKAEQ